MYKKGDIIIYGNIGICKVAEVTTRSFSGADKGKLFYSLDPLFSECSTSTPVDNTKVFMRPVISKEEAEDLIDMIPTIESEPFYTRVMRELTEHYEQFMCTHECIDLIKLVLSITEKKQQMESQNRKFGEVDKTFLHKAEELLYEEFSVALDIPKESVPEYIAQSVDKALIS